MQEELIPQLFKTEYRKIISVLCKLFGIVHIEIAEDITNDTFLLASETWGMKGVPANPKAWLYAVAKNKTKDYFKRNKIFIEKISVEIKRTTDDFDELELDLSEENIFDSQLQMIFAICNPIISSEAQIGLALRILCGFGIDEIAAAFLCNKATINKRLYRAKEKLRQENIVVEMPPEHELSQRIDSVLSTIYLLFSEGYYSTTQNKNLRKELCFEAMRLNFLLIENKKTNLPKVNALMSLMCFHSSRYEARIDDNGALVLYNDQNRDTWNNDLITRGEYHLNLSARGNKISKYHLEASIAYWHTKEESKEKWESILQYYNMLLQIEYSPMAALNRTYALFKVYGQQKAIEEGLKLNLTNNHLYHSLMAEMYQEDYPTKQLYHLHKALELSKTENEKKVISDKIVRMK